MTKETIKQMITPNGVNKSICLSVKLKTLDADHKINVSGNVNKYAKIGIVSKEKNQNRTLKCLSLTSKKSSRNFNLLFSCFAFVLLFHVKT